MFIVQLWCWGAAAAAPTNYYAQAEGKRGADLRAALHGIVRGHHVVPYSSSTKLDTSDALKSLDADPADTNLVVLIYSGSNAPSASFGLSDGWNREHQWCDSYGLDGVEPAYSDLHNLRAIDSNVNSSRGNKYYAVSDTNSLGYRFPAFAEAPLCSTDSDSWQPPLFDRGNIARSLFYMAVRYTGDATNEPALVLTDDVSLIQSSNAYMGRLSTLLAWHEADPVDAAEALRNDLVYNWQTNRNPFIDHPEWVRLVFWPGLEVQRTTNGTRLSWPAEYRDAVVEVTTTLPGSWSTVTNVATSQSNRLNVLLPNATQPQFFRLRLP